MRSTFRIPKARELFDALKAKKNLRDAEQAIGVSLSDDAPVPSEESSMQSPARQPVDSLPSGDEILAAYIDRITGRTSTGEVR
ncbi:hypothetical protein I6I10_06985 [Corynebacterium glucuronolyticum]|uniref:Uncharacterized protein n=1 Tax=Corynebacterium glucuronolyticum TaxID=39791 RepID=A0A7T4EHP7_9CORY|nr:hypothetical protein [Corynebacterium glucuronolyticum]QQB47603.1 hypothetical protein I6I10_06985 [Corynebacterium glucuronolyticum]